MKKPIGYQVVDNSGDYPEGMFSFQVFSLNIALKVQNQDKRRWRLLPIYEGDVEDPTIMSDEDACISLLLEACKTINSKMVD